MEHTATPWKVFNSHGIVAVQCEGTTDIVQWSGFDDSFRTKAEHLANAAHIVKCVNDNESLMRVAEFLDEEQFADAYELAIEIIGR